MRSAIAAAVAATTSFAWGLSALHFSSSQRHIPQRQSCNLRRSLLALKHLNQEGGRVRL